MKKKWGSYLIKWLKYTFLTTGISLFLLACFAQYAGGSCIFIHTVFENLAANACIHLGLYATGQFESRYAVFNVLLDVTVATAIIFGAGLLFGWFSSVPPLVLGAMVILVYSGCFVFQICRTQADIRYINEKLKRK